MIFNNLGSFTILYKFLHLFYIFLHISKNSAKELPLKTEPWAAFNDSSFKLYKRPKMGS